MKLSTIKELALGLGFDDCGAAAVQRLDRDADFMDRWVDGGYAGKMDYLERNRDKRYDIAALVPGAKTVVVCLLTYEKSGRDYHRTVKSKLYQLEAAIKESFDFERSGLSTFDSLTNPDCQHIFCDSAPVLERRWAQLAGLGTIGHNHQLIHPTLGSFVHPGELVLNIEVEDVPPQREVDWRIGAPCGDCRACIEACPGKALGHEVWDPRLCIAYETHHCTVCQAVCPKNRQKTKDMNPVSSLRIALASDHAGYALKQKVMQHLTAEGATIHDFGCYSTESCDYPDFAHPLAAAVEKGEYDFGITICSTGNGICMTANKHQGIRAALCWEVRLAELARQHNNANVLGLPANFVSEELALKMVDTFFSTDFEGGRHERRVNKIAL